jgi:hypothetical protein
MTESSELGPDQLFDQRVVIHQNRIQEAESAAQKAFENLGEISPQVLEYVSATERLHGLKSDGEWLIAAQNTLGPKEREALARVRETMRNPNNDLLEDK